MQEESQLPMLGLGNAKFKKVRFTKETRDNLRNRKLG